MFPKRMRYHELNDLKWFTNQCIANLYKREFESTAKKEKTLLRTLSMNTYTYCLPLSRYLPCSLSPAQMCKWREDRQFCGCCFLFSFIFQRVFPANPFMFFFPWTFIWLYAAKLSITLTRAYSWNLMQSTLIDFKVPANLVFKNVSSSF